MFFALLSIGTVFENGTVPGHNSAFREKANGYKLTRALILLLPQEF